jgi:hypothetical protein
MAALGPRFSVGVELGVQTGSFSEKLLNHWPTNKKYYMVDLWGKQVGALAGAPGLVDPWEQQGTGSQPMSQAAWGWPSQLAVTGPFPNSQMLVCRSGLLALWVYLIH